MTVERCECDCKDTQTIDKRQQKENKEKQQK